MRGDFLPNFICVFYLTRNALYCAKDTLKLFSQEHRPYDPLFFLYDET